MDGSFPKTFSLWRKTTNCHFLCDTIKIGCQVYFVKTVFLLSSNLLLFFIAFTNDKLLLIIVGIILLHIKTITSLKYVYIYFCTIIVSRKMRFTELVLHFVRAPRDHHARQTITISVQSYRRRWRKLWIKEKQDLCVLKQSAGTVDNRWNSRLCKWPNMHVVHSNIKRTTSRI